MLEGPPDAIRGRPVGPTSRDGVASMDPYKAPASGISGGELHDDAPDDKYSMAYSIFFLLGIGTLFPWNAFITVTAYFKHRLQGSSFEATFENYFVFVFQLSNIVTLLLVTKYQGRYSIRSRVLGSLSAMFVVFLCVTVMIKIESIGATVFFGSTLFLVFLSGATTAWLQGGMFGFGGQLPLRFTQALMGGQGVGGLLVAGLNLATLLGSANKEEVDVSNAAFIFFSCSLIIIFMCAVFFRIMLELPIIKYYKSSQEMAQEDEMLINSDDRTPLLASPPSQSSLEKSDPSMWRVFKKIRLMAILVWFNFTVTLSIFPGIASNIQSRVKSRLYRDHLFVPIYCFVGFNLGDVIGRTLAGKFQIPSFRHHRRLTWPILARTLFIPAFLLCNVHLAQGDTRLPRLFDSDSYPYVFMLLLGMTNGYFGTLCMMFGPTIVDAREQEAAGSMMALGLTSGVGCGGIVSFGLHAVVCLCNPFVANS